MAIKQQIRGFLRAFRKDSGFSNRPTRHKGHSLARALRHSTQVGGGRAGIPRAGTEQQHKIVAESHERYNASLEKKD